ncbi:MAG: DUF1289 domain-containing protein [Betaproteobacteria bacterium HGW-Betaproteobacteria-7]|jgi:hypothetical protein|nr:MAG: DUF1289 domain-containing protein [Betaproteobacteria bacterium HGW-Betaproteobacteria-7]
MTPSPCINLCKMDPTSGLCAGCYRTLDEIAAWSGFDDRRRDAVLAAIAARRALAASTLPATRPGA